VSLIVDVSTEGMRLPLSRDRMSTIATKVLAAEKVDDALISIACVNRAAIAKLNRRHLGIDGPTDVIAFGLGRAGGRGPVVGDIYISPEIARENARRYGSGIRMELARLVVHGTLHVLGHDHPSGEDRTTSPMWKRQEALLKRVFEAGR
jgi:probable rRNA maturation factor